MKIGLCATASDGGLSGISVYMRAMVRWLPELGAGHAFELIADERDLDYLSPAPDTSVVPLEGHLARPLRNILWHQLELPLLARRRGYDVVLLLAANRRVPLWCPCPAVGTVHDLSSFHVDGKYDPVRDLYVRRVLPGLIHRLAHVITVSEASRRDIVERCAVPASRVAVIPHGIDRDRFSPGDAARAREALAPFGVRAPFLVYVSRVEHPGKNHVGLIDAFDRLKARGAPHQLVLAGADRERADEVHARAAASPFARDIRFLGFTPDPLVPELYRAADALVFPSLYEGFGLPVLEAMACGAPVLCSGVSSLPEVGGAAARYFDPRAPDRIAEALEEVTADAGVRERLARASLARAAEFSMEAAARRTLAVLEETAQRALSARWSTAS